MMPFESGLQTSFLPSQQFCDAFALGVTHTWGLTVVSHVCEQHSVFVVQVEPEFVQAVHARETQEPEQHSLADVQAAPVIPQVMVPPPQMLPVGLQAWPPEQIGGAPTCFGAHTTPYPDGFNRSGYPPQQEDCESQ